MFSQIVLPALLLGTLVAPSPTPKPHVFVRNAVSAADLIAAIMPTSNTCSGATFPDECRTAAEAAPYLIDAMQKYGVYSPGEIAGVLSLVGYESVDMKYKHNVSPGRVGQGTSNMQMASFNEEFAKSIPQLQGKVDSAGDAGILALVTPDDYNFQTGPWFLTTKCASIRSQLQQGTDAGFAAYMGCVGVEVTTDRQAYWTRAKTAFGL